MTFYMVLDWREYHIQSKHRRLLLYRPDLAMIPIVDEELAYLKAKREEKNVKNLQATCYDLTNRIESISVS